MSYRAMIEGFDPRVGVLYDIFDQYNADFFNGAIPELPILTVATFPYGRCIGQTVMYDPPRIDIMRSRIGVDHHDVVLHEMLHAYLSIRGEAAKHHLAPWAREVERITPLYLGVEIKAQAETRPYVNGVRTRWTPEGHLTRDELAHWPQSVRSKDTQLHVPAGGKA